VEKSQDKPAVTRVEPADAPSIVHLPIVALRKDLPLSMTITSALNVETLVYAGTEFGGARHDVLIGRVEPGTTRVFHASVGELLRGDDVFLRWYAGRSTPNAQA
jgi:hypothetical protein